MCGEDKKWVSVGLGELKKKAVVASPIRQPNPDISQERAG
jgi:hypothetical protein